MKKMKMDSVFQFCLSQFLCDFFGFLGEIFCGEVFWEKMKMDYVFLFCLSLSLPGRNHPEWGSIHYWPPSPPLLLSIALFPLISFIFLITFISPAPSGAAQQHSLFSATQITTSNVILPSKVWILNSDICQ